MKAFHLTRKEMAHLLLSLKGWHSKSPLAILQDAWRKTPILQQNKESLQKTIEIDSIPPIFEKIMKYDSKDTGFSLNEIAALGNQIENTSFSITAIQNWVKRDIKDMIGSPQKGKKYSIEQAALLFIVEDLKTALDFDSIRKLLQLIVNDPADQEDDLINPVQLYSAYSSVFEELNTNYSYLYKNENYDTAIQRIEIAIEKKAKDLAYTFHHATKKQQEAITNVIVIASLSVHTAYFQMMAKRYLSATLFLQNLEDTSIN